MEARFAAPLYFLGLVPVLALALMMLWRRAHGLTGFSWFRFAVWTLGLSLCVVALARPQMGRTLTESKNQETDLVIALDISRSMLVSDVVPSRLEFSISFLKSLFGLLPGARVTVFPFALDGYVLVPATDDIESAMDMISSLHPNFVLNQGTDLSTALETLHVYLAQDRAKSIEKNDPPRKPQVVVLSDGETHVPIRPEVFQAYRASQIPIFSIGVGTTEGGRVPLERRMSSEFDGLNDEGTSRNVLSKLNSAPLQKISEATQGDYFPGQFGQANRLARTLEQTRQLGRTQTAFRVDRELFPFFLVAAFFIFFLEFLGARWEFALRGVLYFALLTPTAFAAEAEDALQNEPHPETRAAKTFNLGVEKLKNQDFAKAANLFRDSAEISKDQTLVKKAWFNAGNALLKSGEAQGALEAYQRSYDLNAGNPDFNADTNRKISENMALAMKVVEQMKSQPQEGKGQESDSGDNKKEQQPQDPKGPQKFKSQNFSEAQRKKIFDLVSAEEQQTMQRIQDGKNRKSGQSKSDKPW